MTNALREAESLGLDTVQVFTKNQQQWKVNPLQADAVAEWKREIDRLGWQDRTVSHASYLINLASVNDELWQKSVDLMTVEIERCEQLGIPFLVHHPGSHVGGTLEDGLANIIRAYRELFTRTKGFKTVCCLEGTVGSGSHLGGPFEHLRDLRRGIIEAAGNEDRIGFCLDTCHLHAAGHDLSTAASARAVFDRFDDLCGLTHLRVMHLNDSKGKLASKLDRHEHIGEGWVGGGATAHTGKGAFDADRLKTSGLAAVVNHPAIKPIPKILETPKGSDDAGIPFDTINLNRLRSLMGQKPVPPPDPAAGVAQTKPSRPTGKSASITSSKTAAKPAPKASPKPAAKNSKPPAAKKKAATKKPSPKARKAAPGPSRGPSSSRKTR